MVNAQDCVDHLPRCFLVKGMRGFGPAHIGIHLFVTILVDKSKLESFTNGVTGSGNVRLAWYSRKSFMTF